MKACVHDVLCALYERDCRRPFCTPGQWAVLPSLGHIPPELFLEGEGRLPPLTCCTYVHVPSKTVHVYLSMGKGRLTLPCVSRVVLSSSPAALWPWDSTPSCLVAMGLYPQLPCGHGTLPPAALWPWDSTPSCLVAVVIEIVPQKCHVNQKT